MRQLKANFIIIISLTFICQGFAHAKPKKIKNNGLITNFKNLISDHKIELKTLFKKTRSKNTLLRNLKKNTTKKNNQTINKTINKTINETINEKQNLEMKIHPLFMQSLFLYSNESYLQLASSAQEDLSKECLFYNLLGQNLLRYAFGEVNHLIVTYNEKNKRLTSIITKEEFLENLYKTKCYKNKERDILFTKIHIKKTIEQLAFSSPKTLSQCKRQFYSLKNEPLLPNLCQIHKIGSQGKKAALRLLSLNEAKNPKKYRQLKKQVKKHDFIKENISFYNRNYIDTICSHLNSPDNFCKPFMQDDIWIKILSGERPNYLMDYKCQDSLKTQDPLSAKQRQTCAKKFARDNNYCTNHGNSFFPSLFPMPKCKTIDQGLKNSRLKTDYHDCPGLIDNESIINLHRILVHINDKKVITNKNSCTSESNLSFYQMNREYKNNRKWPLQICYFDKALEKEVCTPYIPGENLKSELSENKVVAKILYKTQGSRFDIKCRIISKKSYNPARLEYKSGCFIIFEKNNCSSLHCPKEVIYDRKEITHLNYKGELLFEYIPNSYTSKNFSATNIIEKVYKKRSKTILNLTELKYYFKKKKKGLIHGIGCAESLLPQFFKKVALNGCKPLPFIIDGITSADLLVIRTSIDDLHSPRLMHWSFVFSAIAAYKNLHPLKTWAFYGLY